MAQTRTLAFEIGVEEIPAFDLVDAVKQLERKVPALLDDARIPHGGDRSLRFPASSYRHGLRCRC